MLLYYAEYSCTSPGRISRMLYESIRGINALYDVIFNYISRYLLSYKLTIAYKGVIKYIGYIADKEGGFWKV